MRHKQDVLDDIRSHRDVISLEQTMEKEITSDTTHYAYKCVYLDDDDVAQTEAYHVAVSKEGTESESAHYMERKPEWQRQGTTPSLSSDALRRVLSTETNNEVISVTGSGDAPLEFTALTFDEEAGVVAKRRYAAFHDSNGDLQVTGVVDKTTST